MNFEITQLENCDLISPNSNNFSLSDLSTLQDILGQSNKLKKNTILSFKHVNSIDKIPVESFTQLIKSHYENNCSFVICELKSELKNHLISEQNDFEIQIAPQLIEAQEIVNMEIIERELMADFDDDII